jgi:hypothetical protein
MHWKGSEEGLKKKKQKQKQKQRFCIFISGQDICSSAKKDTENSKPGSKKNVCFLLGLEGEGTQCHSLLCPTGNYWAAVRGVGSQERW